MLVKAERGYWLRAIGPAGAVSLLSLLVAWAAIGFVVAGQLKWAVLCALAAFLLDMLDGFVARRLGVVSEFGRLLDSMIDLVNYSLFCAVLVAFHIVPGVLGWAVGFVIVATGALRLVRFSIEGFEDEQNRFYRGLVTPHLSLATIALLFVRPFIPGQFMPLWVWGAAAILVVLSLLQLTTIRIRKTGRQALWASLVVPLGIAAALWLP